MNRSRHADVPEIVRAGVDGVSRRWAEAVRAELSRRRMLKQDFAAQMGVQPPLLSDLLAGRARLGVSDLVRSLLILGQPLEDAWPTAAGVVDADVLLRTDGWAVGDGTLPSLHRPTPDIMIRSGLLAGIALRLAELPVPDRMIGTGDVVRAVTLALREAGAPIESLRSEPAIGPVVVHAEWPGRWSLGCAAVTRAAVATRGDADQMASQLRDAMDRAGPDGVLIVADWHGAADMLTAHATPDVWATQATDTVVRAGVRARLFGNPPGSSP